MTAVSQLDHALEDLLRFRLDLPRLLDAIDDAQEGQPGGQRFDVVRSGGRTVLHCWKHERDVRDCEEAGLDCDGEAIDVNDPTGEAGVNPDKARADRRRVSRKIQAITDAIEELIGIRAGHLSSARIVNDRAGIGECDSCRHYCNGEKDDRLRPINGLRACNACRMRISRQRQLAPVPK